MEKVTLRLPEWEVERLREESRAQGKSLNTVASEVIGRGLGQPTGAADLIRQLGPMVARPPVRPYRAEAAGVDRPGLSDALDWSRGDR